MNDEQLSLLDKTLDNATEDISLLLDALTATTWEFDQQYQILEGLTPDSPNLQTTLATLTPFLTTTTALGVLDIHSAIETDTVRLQQEFTRLRSQLRRHQQQW